MRVCKCAFQSKGEDVASEGKFMQAATKANFARSRLASVNMQLQHLRRQGKEQNKDIQDALKRRQQHSASLEVSSISSSLTHSSHDAFAAEVSVHCPR